MSTFLLFSMLVENRLMRVDWEVRTRAHDNTSLFPRLMSDAVMLLNCSRICSFFFRGGGGGSTTVGFRNVCKYSRRIVRQFEIAKLLSEPKMADTRLEDRPSILRSSFFLFRRLVGVMNW